MQIAEKRIRNIDQTSKYLICIESTFNIIHNIKEKERKNRNMEQILNHSAVNINLRAHFELHFTNISDVRIDYGDERTCIE